jgi:carbonic anhydrase
VDAPAGRAAVGRAPAASAQLSTAFIRRGSDCVAEDAMMLRMTATDDLIANNTTYAEAFDHPGLGVAPARKLAVVACMDSRLDLFGALGLELGEVHMIRNAGGVVTDDVIRSLVISQRTLGTEEILVLQHTDCGLLKATDEELKDAIEADVGVRPGFAFDAFTDLDLNVRRSLARLRATLFLLHTDRIRGFVYDVDTGRIREVT